MAAETDRLDAEDGVCGAAREEVYSAVYYNRLLEIHKCGIVKSRWPI